MIKWAISIKLIAFLLRFTTQGVTENNKNDLVEDAMELFYKSTRDDNVKVTASKAILKGLADDGGLFVPESIPVLDKSFEELSKLSYGEVAYEVMKLFFTDFTEEELKNCIANAYDSTACQGGWCIFP